MTTIIFDLDNPGHSFVVGVCDNCASTRENYLQPPSFAAPCRLQGSANCARPT